MKEEIIKIKYKQNYIGLLIVGILITILSYLQRNVDFTTGRLGKDFNYLWLIFGIYVIIISLYLKYKPENRIKIKLVGERM